MTAFFASAVIAIPIIMALVFIVPNRTAEEYMIGYFILAILFLPLCNSWFRKENNNEG